MFRPAPGLSAPSRRQVPDRPGAQPAGGRPSALGRPGRRAGYIARLLESELPALEPEAGARLVGSLTLLFGIDPIVSIRDNSDINPKAISDVLAWAAHELVRSAVGEQDRV